MVAVIADVVVVVAAVPFAVLRCGLLARAAWKRITDEISVP